MAADQIVLNDSLLEHPDVLRRLEAAAQALNCYYSAIFEHTIPPYFGLGIGC
jgi:hypothetical protein